MGLSESHYTLLSIEFCIDVGKGPIAEAKLRPIHRVEQQIWTALNPLYGTLSGPLKEPVRGFGEFRV